jgi:hypothetical protein
MATAPEFRTELHRRFREAEAAGRKAVDVSARDLHDVGQRINPTRTTRYPNVCSVMRQEQRPGVDEVISERASDGPNFAICYRLPR